MYKLDNALKIPLHIQLYDALKKDIVQKQTVGEKLPSIRKLSSLYNISKTTVESAYSQLYAEGFIDSQPKKGYFVADILYEKQHVHNNTKSTQQQKKSSYKYDFFPAQLRKEDFPLKTWKRLFNKAVDESLDFGSYLNGQGELGLREEISSYLNSLRGV
ncbi:GntR family transcriptional regulator [Sulfurimonas sp.]